MVDFDENTTDPAALAAMFEQLEGPGANQAAAQPDPASAPAPAPAEAPAAPAPAPAPAAPPVAEPPAAPAAQTEPTPDGIATKDGKHVIPYSVLQSEREARTKAEQQLADLQKRTDAAEAAARAALEKGEKPGAAAPDSKAQAAADDLSPEELEQLKEDFPTMYKGLMATRAAADRLAERLKPVQETVEQSEEQRRATLAQNIRDAIDATPKMAHIQATSAPLFEQAKQFDNLLMSQAEWAGRPLAERFAKVVELVEATNGVITLPGAAAQPPAAAAQTPEDQRKLAQATAAAAAAKAALAGTVPTSLTAFPAGQPVATSEREGAENMSQAQLYAKMSAMNPDQLDAYLTNL